MPKRNTASTSSALERAENLLSDSAVSARAETAAVLAAEYSNGEMGNRERKVAVGILQIMAKDVEAQVREALAEQVKACPFLPESLAMTLASDIETVALPVIQFSSVLGERDLLSIIDAGNVAKQIAVAKRDVVTPGVADALVETNNEQVVGTLLANEGAKISEKGYGKVMDRFQQNQEIQTLVADRASLPLSIVERLIANVSVELRERVINRHNFPRDVADDIIRHSQESVLIQNLASEYRAPEVEGLILRLKSKGELTPSLILRSLCEGDLIFFEGAIAAMAGVPSAKARPFLYERGAGGLRMIFRNTGLPNEMFRAIKIAMDEINSVKQEDPKGWHLTFAERIVQRLLEEYEHLSIAGGDNVLSRLSHGILGDIEDEPDQAAEPGDARW